MTIYSVFLSRWSRGLSRAAAPRGEKVWLTALRSSPLSPPLLLEREEVKCTPSNKHTRMPMQNTLPSLLATAIFLKLVSSRAPEASLRLELQEAKWANERAGKYISARRIRKCSPPWIHLMPQPPNIFFLVCFEQGIAVYIQKEKPVKNTWIACPCTILHLCCNIFKSNSKGMKKIQADVMKLKQEVSWNPIFPIPLNKSEWVLIDHKLIILTHIYFMHSFICHQMKRALQSLSRSDVLKAEQCICSLNMKRILTE